MVFGPDDGNLYVSNYELPTPYGAELGSVLRFSPTGAYLGQFVARGTGTVQLQSPEGLTFGPDHNLYVTSCGHNQDDYIIQYNGTTGAYMNSIDLGTAGTSRLEATCLFGPDGKLWVPMESSGEVRRYDVQPGSNFGTYTDFLTAGGTLVNPWYMTFGNTDPGTLQYVPEPSTFMMLGIGAFAFTAYAWRRRKRTRSAFTNG